mmetsp:Transcript_24265/g.43003  ORF Transcript_24265/g.43003 Transcript_24265/m.43003 type:complete len:241 (+) Transcript_24265:1409-2131(+)
MQLPRDLHSPHSAHDRVGQHADARAQLRSGAVLRLRAAGADFLLDDALVVDDQRVRLVEHGCGVESGPEPGARGPGEGDRGVAYGGFERDVARDPSLPLPEPAALRDRDELAASERPQRTVNAAGSAAFVGHAVALAFLQRLLRVAVGGCGHHKRLQDVLVVLFAVESLVLPGHLEAAAVLVQADLDRHPDRRRTLTRHRLAGAGRAHSFGIPVCVESHSRDAVLQHHRATRWDFRARCR